MAPQTRTLRYNVAVTNGPFSPKRYSNNDLGFRGNNNGQCSPLPTLPKTLPCPPPPIDIGDSKPKITSFENSDVATNDLCDANKPLLSSEEIRVLPPIFQIYGQKRKFSGQIVTLKMDDDNKSVWELVHKPGNGRILLIDASGQKRCAVIGGILTEVAHYMGWAGVVVHGCIRDVDDINAIDIGVRALASHPVKPKQIALSPTHVSVKIDGVLVHDGEWLYADSDGILVSKSELDLHAAYEYKVDFDRRHSIKYKIAAKGL